jgi:hypothetical protein
MNDIFEKKFDKLIDEAVALVVEKTDIPEPAEKHKFSQEHEAAMKNLFRRDRGKIWYQSFSRYAAHAAVALLFVAVVTTVTVLDLPFNRPAIDNDVIETQGTDDVIYGTEIEALSSDAQGEITTERQAEISIFDVRSSNRIIRGTEANITETQEIRSEEIRAAAETYIEETFTQSIQSIQTRRSLADISPLRGDDEIQFTLDDVSPREITSFGIGFSAISEDIDAQAWGMGGDDRGFSGGMPSLARQSAVEIGGIIFDYIPFGFTLDFSIVDPDRGIFAQFVSGDLVFIVRADSFGSAIAVSGNIGAEELRNIQTNVRW